MERYKARPGVVLTSVCGEYLLVSIKALKDVCPFMTTLNESSAFLWQKLVEGTSQDELIVSVMAEYEVEDPASLRKGIQDFLKQM